MTLDRPFTLQKLLYLVLRKKKLRYIFQFHISMLFKLKISKKIYGKVKNEKFPTLFYTTFIIIIKSNLKVNPLSNSAARCCTVLASIAMQNIKEIHCSILKKMQRPKTWSKCCTVFAFIVMQNIKKFIVEFPRKCQKIQFFDS